MIKRHASLHGACNEMPRTDHAASRRYSGADHCCRPRCPFKALPFFLHPLQLAFPSSNLALRGQKLRSLGQCDELSEFPFFKSSSFDSVLKGVELAAQEFLT